MIHYSNSSGVHMRHSENYFFPLPAWIFARILLQAWFLTAMQGSTHTLTLYLHITKENACHHHHQRGCCNRCSQVIPPFFAFAPQNKRGEELPFSPGRPAFDDPSRASRSPRKWRTPSPQPTGDPKGPGRPVVCEKERQRASLISLRMIPMGWYHI